jgi:HprK-related kinase A
LKVSELARDELASQMRRGEFLLDLPPFIASIRSDLAGVVRDVATMYGAFDTAPPATFVDFHIEVLRERGPRGWLRPQARFFFDGQPAFAPLPEAQGYSMVEWGLNWCVAAHAHEYLIIHAAVIEKAGRAVLLPARPGAGKSTLCAALVQSGWRLLSDELALVDIETGLVRGMARPVNLKNASIAAIRSFAPAAVLTSPVPDTLKGTVALMQPPDASVLRVREPAEPTWIVLPRYVANAPAEVVAHNRAQTLLLMADQSFNYDVHGANGFAAMSRLVGRCSCHRFTYGKMHEAVAVFDELASQEERRS